MRRIPTVSALLALALLTTAAIGQPPPGAPKQPEKKADKKVADPTAAAIAAALVNDPDVKMAKAKIQLAEAELAKARFAVTQKVFAAQAAVQQARLAVRTAEVELQNWLNLLKAEKAPDPQTHPNYQLAREKVELAKSKLAAAETELKLLTTGGSVAGAIDIDPNQGTDSALKWFGTRMSDDALAADRLARYFAVLDLVERTAVKGPIPDRIRAALDKSVKLGAKGEKVTFAKALETFKKEAGLDVPVRGSLPLVERQDPKNPNEIRALPIEIELEGEELSVGAWFQLFEDNAVAPHVVGAGTTRYRFYVREYGLLVSATDAAPPDAPTLTDFWKRKPPPAKDAKPETPSK